MSLKNIRTPAQALEYIGSQYDVSRETLTKYQTYADQLVRWQRAVNLVSPSTLPDLWVRHMIDSAQILKYMPKDAKTVVDLGSGGGFPAMVLAITGRFAVHCIESDRKKIEFLRTVSRETGTKIDLHCCRIENAPQISADVITSRALASLDKLVTFAQPFSHEKTVALFLKGEKFSEEIACTKQQWDIKLSTYTSITDSNGAIIKVEGLKNAIPTPKNSTK